MPEDANKFCLLSDLGGEASVEQFFISRLLADLNYADHQIAPKVSLSAHSVNLGRRKVNYRPDYALRVNGQVRWICDAKAVDEDLADWRGQCASYCLELNRGFDDNPVEYFVLSNGVATELWRWDGPEPLMTLSHADFVDDSHAYAEFRKRLAPDSFVEEAPHPDHPELFSLDPTGVAQLNGHFAWAHRYIHRRENLGYAPAFMEFVKIIFLKLLSDRDAHDSPDAIFDAHGTMLLPAEQVWFTTDWIADREKDHANPLDAIKFQALLEELEDGIDQNTKKRIFPKRDKLNLSNETVKALVDRLEHVDLFGIDADLNGRLFETFLNATLRGKDLGQYFTPRSVVKLATALADLRADPEHVDTVLDACCGTGGFLIEALATMWTSVEDNSSLSDTERNKMKVAIATMHLIGVDVARDPVLARIARVNMFLHGDGGTRIYQVDSLDKSVGVNDTDTTELKREKRELRQLLAAHPNGVADVVLTNPPFAKEYSRDQPQEAAILDTYELGFETTSGSRRAVSSRRSSVLFFERYHNLLKVGGRLITVIDDGILGGDSDADVRDWIRKRFLVRAVISLPGDAFQRSQARVKTSLLILEKRDPATAQEQPDVFMYYCTSVGVDDPSRQRILPGDDDLRREAEVEIATVADLHRAFRRGDAKAGQWTVTPDDITDRLDVKACLLESGRRISDWEARGFATVTIDSLIEPIYTRRGSTTRPEDVIDTQTQNDLATMLRVRYDGTAESGDEVSTGDSNYHYLYRVRTGDIVVSHINAIHGAAAVIGPAHDGHVVSHEYTVCRVLDKSTDPRFVWSMLRSTEVRADLLLLSTGIGRTRIGWDELSQLTVPLPAAEVISLVVDRLAEAERLEREAERLRGQARVEIDDTLQLDSDAARAIIAAFKPPR